MQSNVHLREHSAIKPHLHLQYDTPPNKQMFPLQSALFLVTPPTPPRPWQCSFSCGGRGGTGRKAQRWMLPKLAVEELHGVWLCLVSPFQRMQITLKPARGHRRHFPNRAYICNLALPLDEHAFVLRCWSCLCCYVCTGCHQSTQLIFGVCFCFCLCVDFQPKHKDWIIPLTFRSLQHLALTFLRGMQLNTKAAKLSSHEPKHACWLQNVCTFLLSAAFSMPYFRVLAADFPLCCTRFIWRLARWAIQPRSAPRRQNFTTF